MKDYSREVVYSASAESKHKSIRDWREEERPRERLLQYGAASLNDLELLAIIISSGTVGVSAVDLARNLLDEHQSISKLSACDISEFKRIKGIGPAKAVTLSAVFEIGRRMLANETNELKVIRTPDHIAEIYIPKLKNERTENFLVLLMNSHNQIFREVVVSSGSLNSSSAHPREVFRIAITENCASIILLHNHPSGNLEASKEDIQLTASLVEAGKMIGIEVRDHIIIAGNSFMSLLEKGLM